MLNRFVLLKNIQSISFVLPLKRRFSTAMAEGLQRKSNIKLNTIRSIEKEVQELWENSNAFHIDAGQEPDVQDKYFVTFPYPYMNGRLHLGHTFSLSKCEFSIGFQRLKGKRCLFPFAFHCTGMPIKACADKLCREMEEFGFPPKFPENVEKKDTSTMKSKVAAKTGGLEYQWQIMQALGLSDDEIKNFGSAHYWIEYFPKHCMADLKMMGLKVDWRRSFITTDANPYYDSFARWHMTTLKERGKVKFGKRFTIYSIKDGQPCMDHDRQSGEGVAPQEYTLVKMQVVEPFPEALSSISSNKVFLVAATLRPETMYGQTNCWLHPDIKYTVFPARSDGEYLISTSRSAQNMAFQGLTKNDNQVDAVLEITGRQLLGATLKAPLTSNEVIYALPMLTIKEDKGTGVVTSVPSDSPDDLAALRDLQKKEAFRKKYDLKDEMVLPFDPIAIINIPELGDLPAVTTCEMFKVTSQNDTQQLAQAKDLTYKKGFYDGVMLVDEFKGQKVQDVKTLVQAKLIKSGEALRYMEPEKTVVSRSGDECIVALCDQWYLDYGETEWMKKTKAHLDNFETYGNECKHNFVGTLDWLKEHACSRSYGLGSRIPWDEKYLIESLSDSTIYMAYYTVSHLLQGGDYSGKTIGPANIKAEQLTQEVWDYIFFTDSKEPNTDIPLDTLKKLRGEFQYWYPVDMRSSGKDLIPNHLTYFLYNHTAVWENNPELWPKSVSANGHLLLNSEKMSKSTGNFLTLTGAIDKFSADGMRMALADGGDTIEDANFDEKMADACILRLYTFLEWSKESLEEQSGFRSGSLNQFNDLVFENEMNLAIQQSEQAYSQMLYREALKVGFYNLQASRDKYRELCTDGMHIDLVKKYIETQVLILSPICPHICEHIWMKLLHKETSILEASWPSIGPIDMNLIASSRYLMECAKDFRARLKNMLTAKAKGKKKANAPSADEAAALPRKGIVYVAKEYPPWQQHVLSTLKSLHEEHGDFPDNKQIMNIMKTEESVKPFMKKLMPFVAHVKTQVKSEGLKALDLEVPFDEAKVLVDNLTYLVNAIELDSMEIKLSSEAEQKVKDECAPGKPFTVFNA